MDECPFDYTVNEDSDDAIASGQRSQSSTNHLRLLRLAQIRRDPIISELAISAIAGTQFDGKFVFSQQLIKFKLTMNILNVFPFKYFKKLNYRLPEP